MVEVSGSVRYGSERIGVGSVRLRRTGGYKKRQGKQGKQLLSPPVSEITDAPITLTPESTAARNGARAAATATFPPLLLPQNFFVEEAEKEEKEAGAPEGAGREGGAEAAGTPKAGDIPNQSSRNIEQPEENLTRPLPPSVLNRCRRRRRRAHSPLTLSLPLHLRAVWKLRMNHRSAERPALSSCGPYGGRPVRSGRVRSGMDKQKQKTKKWREADGVKKKKKGILEESISYFTVPSNEKTIKVVAEA